MEIEESPEKLHESVERTDINEASTMPGTDASRSSDPSTSSAADSDTDGTAAVGPKSPGPIPWSNRDARYTFSKFVRNTITHIDDKDDDNRDAQKFLPRFLKS